MRMTFNQFLTILCILLLAVILGVTGIAFFTGTAKPGIYLRKNEPIPGGPSGKIQEGYIALEQLRTMTKPDADSDPPAQGVPVVIKPWFSFDKTDSALYEELYQKTRQIEALIRQFFSDHTYSQLIQMGETAVKAELTDSINRMLVLGAVSGIYFDTYIFFE